MTRAALRRATILLAAAIAAAGCATSSAPKASHPADPKISHPAGPGPAVIRAEQRVRCGGNRRAVPLPGGFVAAAAVRCPLILRRVHGRAHVVFGKQVADHGLAPLLAALRRRPEHLPADTACAVQLIAIPELFLISPAGQIIRPGLPSDGCGLPQPQVLDAMRHLPWTTLHAPARP
jgi:hypothetical protein